MLEVRGCGQPPSFRGLHSMTPFLSFSTFSLSADGPLNPASSVSGEGQELLGQDAEAVEFAELFQLQTRTLEPGLASLSAGRAEVEGDAEEDRKSTRLNSSHVAI